MEWFLSSALPEELEPAKESFLPKKSCSLDGDNGDPWPWELVNRLVVDAQSCFMVPDEYYL